MTDLDLVAIHMLSKSISSKLGSQQSQHPSDDFSDPEIATDELKLLVCSWNVGNSPPPKLLDDWIPQDGVGFDLVVCGLQESTFSSKKHIKKIDSAKSKLMMNRRGTNEEREERENNDRREEEEYQSRRDARESADEKLDRQKLVRQLQAQLGPRFNTVASTHLWQMRLIVFARDNLREQVTDVSIAEEATGVGHVVGNKGGLFASFKVGNTSLCFVSCHLAAHEAEKFQRRRNADCAEIIRGCSHAHLKEKAPHIPKKRPLAKKSNLADRKKVVPELTDHYHHAFWFGDLNYRIDLALAQNPHHTAIGEGGKHNHKNHFRQVQELIDAENWPALHAADGLNSELAQHKVLSGWTAATPNFAPTFKLHRGQVGHYKDHRIPSYCDRVLWKSMPALADMLSCTSFHSVPSITTSDHTPVAAAFTIKRSSPIVLSNLNPLQLPTLIFSQLSASGTRSRDISGRSDPFVSFFCDPPGIVVGTAIGDHTTPQTGVCHNTLTPVWRDADNADHDSVPNMRLRVSSRESLRHAHLVFCLVDHDLGMYIMIRDLLLAMTDRKPIICLLLFCCQILH